MKVELIARAGKDEEKTGQDSIFLDILKLDHNFDVEIDFAEFPLLDPGRERITRNGVHLYFNLTDKSERRQGEAGSVDEKPNSFGN